VGIIAATVLRITFAAATTQLLQVVGLVLAGGILLLWVSWKMFRELRLSAEGKGDAIEAMSNMDINADGTIARHAPRKSFAQAASQIVVADLSMSLDNVLAVAGAAREHLTVLIIGLGLSVAHGHRGELYRSAVAQASVDRLCGIARDPVCRRRDDLPRNGRGLAPDNPFVTSRLEWGQADGGTVRTPIAELIWVESSCTIRAWNRMSWTRIYRRAGMDAKGCLIPQAKPLNSNSSSGIAKATMTTSTDPRLARPIACKTTSATCE
jgi:hypothetical protein